MKRALVAYSSDSETEPPPTKRKKALPKLSESLTIPAPVDDPSKHQGRKRSQPYVEGQFAGYVYIPILLDAPFKTLLNQVMQDVHAQVQGVHTLFNSGAVRIENEEDNTKNSRDDTGMEMDEEELHLSLSRPIYLREHQRDMARRHVKRLADTSNAFKFSLASFTILTNDEKTRSFLAVEVGAGHAEFEAFSNGLNPLLTELRQPLYYSSARYHISFAWILSESESGNGGLSEDLAKQLDDKYGSRLRDIIMDVDKINLKIGKQIQKCRLK